ncbi:MAG: peptide-methionine (S)-S-oxide reductase MsrA [Thermoplasmata archaeon]
MIHKAIFAAGCFWGVEAAFAEIRGVKSTTVGYTGGSTRNPTYEQVCTNTTGHAESVLVVYDPTIVSYEQLLEIFWNIHDPTTKDRQGPDLGHQYRSAIFYHSNAQRDAAIASRDRLQASGELGKRQIVTEILPAMEFYPAEERHQKYYRKHGFVSCRAH